MNPYFLNIDIAKLVHFYPLISFYSTFFNFVNVQRLTQKLQEVITKWPQGILAQGVWFQEFHTETPDSAMNFMIETMAFVIKKTKNSQIPSGNWVYAIAPFLALFLGVALHECTTLKYR